MPAEKPVNESKCGKCPACVQKCPAKALTGVLWNRTIRREQILRKEDCKEMQIQRMKKATGIATDLCGLRFAVCPYKQRFVNRNTHI